MGRFMSSHSTSDSSPAATAASTTPQEVSLVDRLEKFLDIPDYIRFTRYRLNQIFLTLPIHSLGLQGSGHPIEISSGVAFIQDDAPKDELKGFLVDALKNATTLSRDKINAVLKEEVERYESMHAPIVQRALAQHTAAPSSDTNANQSSSGHTWSLKSLNPKSKEFYETFLLWNGPLYIPTTWPAKTVWAIIEVCKHGKEEVSHLRDDVQHAFIDAWKHNKANTLKGAALGTFFLPIVGTIIGGIIGARMKGESKSGEDEHHAAH